MLDNIDIKFVNKFTNNPDDFTRGKNRNKLRAWLDFTLLEISEYFFNEKFKSRITLQHKLNSSADNSDIINKNKILYKLTLNILRNCSELYKSDYFDYDDEIIYLIKGPIYKVMEYLKNE